MLAAPQVRSTQARCGAVCSAEERDCPCRTATTQDLGVANRHVSRDTAVGPQTCVVGTIGTHMPAGTGCEGALWQPTRLTSPYRVLSAVGMQDDYYTSCVSWGSNHVALAQRNLLLHFDPKDPRYSVAGVTLDEDAVGTTTTARHSSAVAVSRLSDQVCFLGMSTGEVALYERRDGGEMTRSASFEMPTPPTADLLTQLHTAPTTSPSIAQRAQTALSRMAHTLSSVTCIATSSSQMWGAMVATSGCGLVGLDSRQARPSICFSADEAILQCDTTSTFTLSSTTTSSAMTDVASPPGCATSPLDRRLRATANTLWRRDRLCSVAWNATGSLVATGSGSGVVCIWSVSNPRTPVQTLQVAPHTTVKALCFHPSQPYELAVGGPVGQGGLRVYDVSAATPQLRWSATTTAQTTQVLYSPDGGHLVSSHGAVQAAATRCPEPALYPAAARDAVQGRRDGALWSSPLAAPLTGAAVTATGITDNAAASPPEPSLPSYALVVWRKRTQHRDSYYRSHLFAPGVSELTGALADDGAADTAHELQCRDICHGGSDGAGRQALWPLVPLYALARHRARPLCLACPFMHSTDAGAVVSVSGGDDKTVRFWRVFQSTPPRLGITETLRRPTSALIEDSFDLCSLLPSLR